MIKELKEDLDKSFEVKDLKQACQILGMEVCWDRQNCTLSFLQRNL